MLLKLQKLDIASNKCFVDTMCTSIKSKCVAGTWHLYDKVGHLPHASKIQFIIYGLCLFGVTSWFAQRWNSKLQAADWWISEWQIVWYGNWQFLLPQRAFFKGSNGTMRKPSITKKGKLAEINGTLFFARLAVPGRGTSKPRDERLRIDDNKHSHIKVSGGGMGAGLSGQTG